MRINLKQVLTDRKGSPIKNQDGEDTTLEMIAYSALINMTPQEANLGRDDRLKRGRLAQRICIIAQDGILDLKAEEITLIKQCIGASYGPWVVALTEDMFEHESPKLSVA